MWLPILLAVILTGAIHGIISAALLLRSSRVNRRHFFLGVLILLIALSNLNIFLLYQSWPPHWQVLGDVLPLVIYMPVGPLLYYYTRTGLYPDQPLSSRFRLHFIPVIFDLFPYLVAACLHLGILTNREAINRFIESYNVFVDIPRWLSISLYLAWSWKICRQAGSTLQIKPIRNTLLPFAIFQLIWLAFLSLYLLPQYQDALLRSTGWFPVYIPLSALIYWIGIQGYRGAIQQVHAPDPVPEMLPGTAPVFVADEKTEAIAAKLRQAMEEQHIYLNPGLTLAVLGAHTGLPPKVISSVLNQYLQTSFNEFVNAYRVQAFREKIILEGMQQYTIAGIAQQCGFNSQATFQRVFKQVTGLSPTEFLKTRPA